jgi:hypothetical protein
MYSPEREWSPVSLYRKGDITAFQWDGGPVYSIHGNSSRHLPDLDLRGLRPYSASNEAPEMVIRLLADGYQRSKIVLPMVFDIDVMPRGDGGFRQNGYSPRQAAKRSEDCTWRGTNALLLPVRRRQLSRGQGGCIAGGIKLCAAKRLGDEDQAVLDMIHAEVRPLEPYPGHNKRWRCQFLRCEQEVAPRLAHIRQGRGGRVYPANVVSGGHGWLG